MDPLWILAFGMAVVVGGILWLRLHAFLALLAGALAVGLLTPRAAVEDYALGTGMSEVEAAAFADQNLGNRIAKELGATAGKIGILIAMAAIIGKCLLDSGGAQRIVREALRLVGVRRAPAAFMGSGFILGVPVFFDTVFYLMMPVGKALAGRTGRDYLLYVMAIIAGATMAHSLVPPTPGPLFVAAELEVNLFTMIVGGMVVGSASCVAGYFYAVWVNRRWPVPLRDTADASVDTLRKQSEQDTSQLPGLFPSLLPILLPIALIGTASIIQNLGFTDAPSIRQSGWMQVLNFVGDKNIALIAAAAAALPLLAHPTGSGHGKTSDAVQNALAGAGVIILITSAGGAFGALLKQTGIGDRIQELSSGTQLGLLPLAFFVTALVRTAQGSATVAMITTVGILAEMAGPGQLDFHPVYLALAIGCGSKPFPWMNDSGFWIISRLSGMTERETLRSFSVMLTLMGLSGLAVIMILAGAFPMR